MDYNPLKNEILSSNIPQDKKDYLIAYIDTIINSSYTDTKKHEKIGLAIDAFNSYMQEAEYKKLKTILADTFKQTAIDITKPFANTFDFINLLTNPIVLSILLMIAIFIFYKYIMR